MWKRQDWGQPRGTGSPSKNGWEVMTTKNILHHVLYSPDLHHASLLTTFCGTNWSCFFQSSWKCLTLLYKFKGLGFILNPPHISLIKSVKVNFNCRRDFFLWKLTAILEKHFFPPVSIPFKLQVLNEIWILLKIGWDRVRKDNANVLTGVWITIILFTLPTISISVCRFYGASFVWYIQNMDRSCELFLVCNTTHASNGSRLWTEEGSAEDVSLSAIKSI